LIPPLKFWVLRLILCQSNYLAVLHLDRRERSGQSPIGSGRSVSDPEAPKAEIKPMTQCGAATIKARPGSGFPRATPLESCKGWKGGRSVLTENSVRFFWFFYNSGNDKHEPK
jgi:hypothetical protein